MSINWSTVGRRRAVSFAALLASLTCAEFAAAQQPSQAQISAIRSNCRSDYMAHCSSVPPGGADSLHCLQQNSSRLSGSCRSAVDALKPPAEPASAPAAPAARPAATATAPATAPAQQPRTQTAKPAPAAKPPQPAPRQRTASAPPPPPAAAPAPPAWVYVPMPPLPLRWRLSVVRACDVDRQALCATVPVGDGRIVDCLAQNEPALSQFCRQSIVNARAAMAR